VAIVTHALQLEGRLTSRQSFWVVLVFFSAHAQKAAKTAIFRASVHNSDTAVGIVDDPLSVWYTDILPIGVHLPALLATFSMRMR